MTTLTVEVKRYTLKMFDAVLLATVAVLFTALNVYVLGFFRAVVVIVFSVLIGMFAHYRRNRNGFGWFAVSLICPIVLFAALAILPKRD